VRDRIEQIERIDRSNGRDRGKERGRGERENSKRNYADYQDYLNSFTYLIFYYCVNANVFFWIEDRREPIIYFGPLSALRFAVVKLILCRVLSPQITLPELLSGSHIFDTIYR
jgi:hypothetical protein